MGVVTLSVGWLLPEVLGQMKPEVYWTWWGNVLRLCFPIGTLTSDGFLLFFEKQLRLYLELYRKLALSSCEAGKVYFCLPCLPVFHNRSFYLEGTSGIARISKLF